MGHACPIKRGLLDRFSHMTTIWGWSYMVTTCHRYARKSNMHEGLAHQISKNQLQSLQQQKWPSPIIQNHHSYSKHITVIRRAWRIIIYSCMSKISKVMGHACPINLHQKGGLDAWMHSPHVLASFSCNHCQNHRCINHEDKQKKRQRKGN